MATAPQHQPQSPFVIERWIDVEPLFNILRIGNDRIVGSLGDSRCESELRTRARGRPVFQPGLDTSAPSRRTAPNYVAMPSTTEAGLPYTAALEELRRLASVREAGGLGLDRALRIICDTIGTPMAKVLELKPAGDLLIVRAGIGWREGIVGCATVPAAQSSSAGYVLAHDGAIIFEDIQRTRRFTDATLLRSHGVTSSIAVRIMRGGIVLGVLSVHELRERRFGAREAKFLEAATPSVAELMREPSPCISKL